MAGHEARHRGTPVLPAPAQPQLAPAQRDAAGPAAPAADGTLLLTTGFSLFPFQTGTLSRRSRDLAQVQPKARLLLNSADAPAWAWATPRPCGSPRREDGAPRNGHPACRAALADLPVEAITLVDERTPPGTAYLRTTLEQVGRSPLVRLSLTHQANGRDGSGKAIAVRVA